MVDSVTGRWPGPVAEEPSPSKSYKQAILVRSLIVLSCTLTFHILTEACKVRDITLTKITSEHCIV